MQYSDELLKVSVYEQTKEENPLLSLEEVKSSIDSAADIKKSEEAEARSQADVISATKDAVNSNADILATSVISTTELEKKSLAAKADTDKAKIGAYNSGIEATREFVSDSTDMRDELLELREANIDKLQEISRRRRGVKLDEFGNEVEMSGAEKLMKNFAANLFEYDHEKEDRLVRQNSNLNQEINSTQAGIANALSNQTAKIELSQDYQDAKARGIDAELLANQGKLDLAEKQTLYNLGKEKYGLEVDKLNTIINIGNLVDEAQRPQQYMQLLGLQLETKRMQYVSGQESSKKELVDNWKTIINNAAKVNGIDVDDPKYLAKENIMATGAATGDYSAASIIFKEDPQMWNVLNSIKPEETLTDLVLSKGTQFAKQVMAGEDTEAKQVAEILLMYADSAERVFLENEDNLEDIQSTADRLFGPENKDSDEYKNFVAEQKQSFIESYARRQVSAIKNNSIDTYRKNGDLPTVTEASLSNFYANKVNEGVPVSVIEQKAATSTAKKLDSEMKTFSSDPARFMEDLVTGIPDLNGATTISERQEIANGITEAFKALKEASDLTLKQETLYQPSDTFSLSADAKISGYNLKGRDLTDPNTVLFLLNAKVPYTTLTTTPRRY